MSDPKATSKPLVGEVPGWRTLCAGDKSAMFQELNKAGCSPSAPMRQAEGLHGGRISGSS